MGRRTETGDELGSDDRGSECQRDVIAIRCSTSGAQPASNWCSNTSKWVTASTTTITDSDDRQPSILQKSPAMTRTIANALATTRNVLVPLPTRQATPATNAMAMQTGEATGSARVREQHAGRERADHEPRNPRRRRQPCDPDDRNNGLPIDSQVRRGSPERSHARRRGCRARPAAASGPSSGCDGRASGPSCRR